MKPSNQTQSPRALWDLFIDGFLVNNIVLVQAVGFCPIIAVGTHLQYGVVLTVCTVVTLILSSLFMSLFGEAIPHWLRTPVFTLGSGAFLLIAAILLDQYISHELFAKLYVFLPLTAVNNLLSYRAGGYSVGKKPLVAVVDALATSLGFGLVICAVSAMREVVAYNTLWGAPVEFAVKLPEAALPFAAFILLGFMAAGLQWVKSVTRRVLRRKEAVR